MSDLIISWNLWRTFILPNVLHSQPVLAFWPVLFCNCTILKEFEKNLKPTFFFSFSLILACFIIFRFAKIIGCCGENQTLYLGSLIKKIGLLQCNPIQGYCSLVPSISMGLDWSTFAQDCIVNAVMGRFQVNLQDRCFFYLQGFPFLPYSNEIPRDPPSQISASQDTISP